MEKFNLESLRSEALTREQMKNVTGGGICVKVICDDDPAYQSCWYCVGENCATLCTRVYPNCSQPCSAEFPCTPC